MGEKIAQAITGEERARHPDDFGWTREGINPPFVIWRDPAGKLWSLLPGARIVALKRKP